MHRISKLTHHVVPEGVVYARIADGDYEKSKHKLQGVRMSPHPHPLRQRFTRIPASYGGGG